MSPPRFAITLLNIGSAAVNESFPGSVPESSLKIQKSISEGEFRPAMKLALEDIKGKAAKPHYHDVLSENGAFMPFR